MRPLCVICPPLGRNQTQTEIVMVFFSLWLNHWWNGAGRLGALNAYAKALPDTGPYNSDQLGMLKQLDQMVNDLQIQSGVQAHLTLLLRSKAMIALPEDTAELLRVRVCVLCAARIM